MQNIESNRIEFKRELNDKLEQLGSGMGRILNAYDRSVFKFTGDFLIVTFPFAEGFGSTIKTNDGVNGVKIGDNEVLDVFRANPNITLNELASVIGVSGRTVDREVDALKASGKLKRIGSTRSGHWAVCE